MRVPRKSTRINEDNSGDLIDEDVTPTTRDPLDSWMGHDRVSSCLSRPCLTDHLSREPPVGAVSRRNVRDNRRTEICCIICLSPKFRILVTTEEDLRERKVTNLTQGRRDTKVLVRYRK